MKLSDTAIRSVHLTTGVFCAVFLLMYGVSAVQMAHATWFDITPTVTRQAVPIDESGRDNARALSRVLMREHGMHGEVTAISERANGFSVQITRPGTVYDVTYRRGDTTADVRSSVSGFMFMLNRIHHIGGLAYESRLLNAWGVFVGLISLGLFGLGATGLWLWFRIYEERVVGGVMLALGLGVGLGLVVLMRWQG